MTGDTNGWSEWKRFVLAALEELKVGQREARDEAKEHRISMSLRLDALEKLQAEQRGGWKVAAWVSGPIGAVLMLLLSLWLGGKL